MDRSTSDASNLPRPARRKLKIAIFNVKYSPNLGDGAIAECLEATLRRVAPNVSVVSLDLAGRSDWVEPCAGGRRAVVLAGLRRLPRTARELVASLGLTWVLRRRLAPHWRSGLNGVDACIVGGGQLIQETDLNFPIKLAGVAALCAEVGLPCAVHAVGVSSCRSRRALRLFQRLWAMPALVLISARDEASRVRLAEMTSRNVGIAGDPALLAAKVWPTQVRRRRPRPRIGMGVAHASILNHHSDTDVRLEMLTGRFVDLARRLGDAGYDVHGFTNGAAEDEIMLDLVVKHARAAGSPITQEARRNEPRDLAAMIAGFDAIVAHRLHAHILAYAYAVPSVALAWDEKLSGFVGSIGRADYLSSFGPDDAAPVASLVGRCLAEGVDPVRQAATIQDAEDAVAELGRALVAACAKRPTRTPLPNRGAVASTKPRSLGVAGRLS